MARKKGLSLLKSEQVRFTLSKEQEKEISAMYTRLAKITSKRAESLSKSNLVSASMRKGYLKNLEKELNGEITKMSLNLNSSIPNSMEKVAQSVVEDNVNFLKEAFMFEVQGKMFNIPKDVVARIIRGEVYQSDWSLSKSLWGDINKKSKDINTIIAEGVALNKSAYDIAKDLEKYVDPAAKKDWDWSKVYPGTNKKVDYNAQRLARTLVAHSYQQSLVESVKHNPLIQGIQWLSSGSHRTCELCNDRDGVIYDKEDLPLDHPNGMCTYLTVIDDNYVDRIADWHNRTSKDPELDRYAEYLGYNPTDK